MAFLAAITAHFSDGQAVDADIGERLAYAIDAVRLDNRDNEFHDGVPSLTIGMIAGFAMGGEIQALGFMVAVDAQSDQQVGQLGNGKSGGHRERGRRHHGIS